MAAQAAWGMLYWMQVPFLNFSEGYVPHSFKISIPSNLPIRQTFGYSPKSHFLELSSFSVRFVSSGYSTIFGFE